MRRVIPAAVLVLLLASCRGESVDAEQPQAAAKPNVAAAAAPQQQSGAASSAQLLSVTVEGADVTIAFLENGAEHELYGESRDSGKRKYTLDEGPVLYEIKPGDDQGFKLRNPDGSLRWKVKVYPDKVKISDNEQNERPYELKVREGNRVKVFAPGDRELGNVRYGSEKIEVETAGGRVIFTLQSAKPAGAYGVLLLDAIPERERYILVAELLSRGR